MKRMFFTVALLTVFVAGGVNAGWISRYWDGCKPSCSWKDKQQHISGTICKECDRNNTPMTTSDNNKSSCDGGTAYTCWDMIPFADPADPERRAFGFAAAPTDQCGKCFEITFDGGFEHGAPYATHAAIKGKVLTVMASNMGGDVGAGQFDILIPGGGVGAFNAFSSQLGISSSALGKQYGGFLGDCEEELKWSQGSLEQYQKCLRDKCDDVFKDPKHALLKEGCNFYADWFMAANNPKMTYKEVECPKLLVERYTTGGNTPTPKPTPTTATLKVKRSPTEGGTTDPADSLTDIAKGTQVNITATPAAGYSFGGWTTSNDSGTIAKTDNASTTITVNGNVTVTANFTKDVISVKYVGAAKARVGIALKTVPGGFSAYLPDNHGYTSYRLINVQGREIRSGKIGAGVSNLSVSGLNHSVFFLRLEGKNKSPQSLKIVSY